MHRSLLAIPLVFALVACGGATDTDATDDRATDHHSSASTCSLTPGEDPCARFPELAPAARSTLAELTALAGASRAMISALEQSCDALLGELGIAPPVPPAGATHALRAQTACDAAIPALASMNPGDVSFALAPERCRPAAIPACIQAPRAETWTTCEQPEVRIDTDTDDSAARRRYADLLRRRLPTFVASMRMLAKLATRTGELAIRIREPAELGACSSPTTELARIAVEEMSTSANITSAAMRTVSK